MGDSSCLIVGAIMVIATAIRPMPINTSQRACNTQEVSMPANPAFGPG